MRLRTPKKVDCPQDWQATTPEDQRRFRVTLLTPMYGGGVKAGEVDADMPIRASAIRGQLRFWWRLLNRAKHQDGPALFRAERDVWGGLGVNEKDVTASKVSLRISKLVDFDVAACAKFVVNRNTGRYRGAPEWAPGISGYAAFPGQGQLENGGREIAKDPALLVQPNFSFELLMICPNSVWNSSVEPTLRWWASFGGLGARTRRGLGSVRVETIDDNGNANLLAPVTAAQAADAGCRLVSRAGKKKAMDVWNEAVKRLRDFRQEVNLGRNPGQTNNRPGRSRWPEPDAIRRISDRHRVKEGDIKLAPEHPAGNVFPRALFGLPIIFHFQGERSDIVADPADCELRPHGADRFASPLILKAMAAGGDVYAPIALLLPSHMELRGRALELRGAQIPGRAHRMAAGDWWRAEQAEHIRPMTGRGDDPLDAFLHYFEKG